MARNASDGGGSAARGAGGLNVEKSIPQFFRKCAQTARLAVGIPDYEAYVAHRRAHHPDEPAMSREEFFRERLAARYRRGTSRCC